jgi:molybdate transport system substrate-binding protein
VRLIARLVLAGSLLAACGLSAQGDNDTVVFAASSLVDVLTELSTDEESAFFGVVLSFASSASLAAQVADGAPVDLFISADRQQVNDLLAAGFGISAPQVIARNSLVIAVEDGNPLGIETLDDLSRSDVLLALAAPGVPLGEYSESMLIAADVEVSPVTFEVDARAVLAKVTLGEVDAGIVYLTDAKSSNDVEFIRIPQADVVSVEYVALQLSEGSDRSDEMVLELLGSRGEQALTRQGFVLP